MKKGILLALLMASVSGYPDTVITQKGYYTVTCNNQYTSRHSSYRKALEASETKIEGLADASKGEALITLEPPTTREDGSPLSIGEIKHYTIYAKWNDGEYHPILRANKLEFKVKLLPGLWTFTATATDINGSESKMSDPKLKEIPLE